MGRGADDGAGGDPHEEERLSVWSAEHGVQEAHQSSAKTEETHLRPDRSSYRVSPY